MELCALTKEIAVAANLCFDLEVHSFLSDWVNEHQESTLLQFEQPLEVYITNDALRDFFLNTRHPVQQLLKNRAIACHLGRRSKVVYFDPFSGDPLLAITEQRIYNLARRMDSESMHVPFRAIHPNKQTEAGDSADINTYPANPALCYNSGNHFMSRPANLNVFNENSKRCTAKSEGRLHILFKCGFLEDRLWDIKILAANMQNECESAPQFFVIYSRHSQQEGHFGTSLVIMDPANPDFPTRVLVCDTLLKDLPLHPRWWNYFIEEYSNVFGPGITEIIEDLSHPLQKVNIKNDYPYNHDWDCPYYAASMADALADLVKADPDMLLNGSLETIHNAMKNLMPDYYQKDHQLKDRQEIRKANRLRRWLSGREMIKELVIESNWKSSYEL